MGLNVNALWCKQLPPEVWRDWRKFLHSKWLLGPRVGIVHQQCRWKWKKRLTFNMQHLARAFTPNIQLQKKNHTFFSTVVCRKEIKLPALQCALVCIPGKKPFSLLPPHLHFHNACLHLMARITEINERAIFVAKSHFSGEQMLVWIHSPMGKAES